MRLVVSDSCVCACIICFLPLLPEPWLENGSCQLLSLLGPTLLLALVRSDGAEPTVRIWLNRKEQDNGHQSYRSAFHCSFLPHPSRRGGVCRCVCSWNFGCDPAPERYPSPAASKANLWRNACNVSCYKNTSPETQQFHSLLYTQMTDWLLKDTKEQFRAGIARSGPEVVCLIWELHSASSEANCLVNNATHLELLTEKWLPSTVPSNSIPHVAIVWSSAFFFYTSYITLQCKMLYWWYTQYKHFT